MIVGIDEVGRGPWAGPLVIGAVVLGDAAIDGLTDSKKLTKLRREELSRQIIGQAASYGIGWVDTDELDEIGLSAALTLATKRALAQIRVPYHEIIIDGTVNFLKDTGKGEYVTTMKKADLLIASVSAASIIAKVARDDYMAECDNRFPGYGFGSHVGYGTAKHLQAIKDNGITSEHRMSFAPIKKLTDDTMPYERKDITGTMKHIGDVGESAASTWLESKGYEIVERNWKTKFCEIDIVALREEVLYFVEVKHRKTKAQGGGVAAITDRKLRQMRFAATLYLTKSDIQDAQLAVITTTGVDTITIEAFLKIE